MWTRSKNRLLFSIAATLLLHHSRQIGPTMTKKFWKCQNYKTELHNYEFLFYAASARPALAASAKPSPQPVRSYADPLCGHFSLRRVAWHASSGSLTGAFTAARSLRSRSASRRIRSTPPDGAYHLQHVVDVHRRSGLASSGLPMMRVRATNLLSSAGAGAGAYAGAPQGGG